MEGETLLDAIDDPHAIRIEGAMPAMNDFDIRVEQAGGGALGAADIETIQVNLGFRCNQECAHCHVEASPQRTESMPWSIMQMVVEAADAARPAVVDLTGGAPELNPYFRRFVDALRGRGHPVQVRTNLTVLLEPGMEEMPRFLRDRGVRLVASLPCYQEENVRVQRGPGVYEGSVRAVRRLNALGYGLEPALPLNLVYNPGGPFLPPEQAGLEEDYRQELAARFGVAFSRLLTITNMPIGRFLRDLREQGRDREYLDMLRESFNPGTLDGLMCRHQVCVGWDGTLYDCDFNLVLGMPVGRGAPDHIRRFDAAALAGRRVVTGEHCFGCTAGCGSSCAGALA